MRCSLHGQAKTVLQRERYLRYWFGLDDDKPLPPTPELVQFPFRDLGEFNFPTPSILAAPNFLGNLRTVALGGFSDDSLTLACYADYTVQEYLLGGGPAIVTVAYGSLATINSYDIYKQSATARGIQGNQLFDEAKYDALLMATETALAEAIELYIGSRESVVLLMPLSVSGNVAVEAWQGIAQWDVQLADDASITESLVLRASRNTTKASAHMM